MASLKLMGLLQLPWVNVIWICLVLRHLLEAPIVIAPTRVVTARLIRVVKGDTKGLMVNGWFSLMELVTLSRWTVTLPVLLLAVEKQWRTPLSLPTTPRLPY